MKLTLKAPGTKRLKLDYDEPLSNFAFKFNLRCYTTDPHAPPEVRVNGTVSNMPEFVAAFGVAEGDGLWRAEGDRVDIW
jgi:hypothetical protein